jgi:hypothetical protein
MNDGGGRIKGHKKTQTVKAQRGMTPQLSATALDEGARNGLALAPMANAETTGPIVKKKKRRRRKKKANGRPRTAIDWEEFDRLCGLQATLEEIAAWFACDIATIERAVKREKELGFAEYFAQKRGVGRVSLRRVQFREALAGNPTMLVWLGKQWLGQRDDKHPVVAATVATAGPATFTLRIVDEPPPPEDDVVELAVVQGGAVVQP